MSNKKKVNQLIKNKYKKISLERNEMRTRRQHLYVLNSLAKMKNQGDMTSCINSNLS